MDRKAAITLAVFLLAANKAAAAPNMKPGMWEVTVSNEMANMPAMRQPVTIRHCYKSEDLRDPKKMMTKQQDPATKCDTREYKIDGDTATWRLECTRQGTSMSGSGTMTMKGESYTGASTMEMKTGGKTLQMTQKMSGKRVGDCSE